MKKIASRIMAVFWTAIFLLGIAFFVYGGIHRWQNPPPPAEPTPTRKDMEDTYWRDGPISFDDLDRYTERYKGDVYCEHGRAFQVVERGKNYTLNIAVRDNVEDSLLGYWTGERVLEDDYVKFCGYVGDRKTYENVMGASNTVPSVRIIHLD